MSITPDTPNNPPLAQEHSGVREYIGARYVPVFADPPEWTDTRAYEPLTIVLHKGNSYTSAQYVPTGIDITNTKYWMLTGNFNAQVEGYRQEVNAFNDRITTNEQDIDALQTDVTELQSEVGITGARLTGKFSYWAVGRTLKNASDQFLYGSVDGIKFEKLTPISSQSDSSSAFEWNGYFYNIGNNQYVYSNDMVNWSAPVDMGMGGSFNSIWACSLFLDGESGYVLGAQKYREGSFNTGNASTGGYRKIVMCPVTQNSDGTLNINVSEMQTILGGNNDSIIDPYMVRVPQIGYILAVKNEVTSKIEIYSGGGIATLTKQSWDCKITGVEAPQLMVDSMGNVNMYIDAYNPSVYNALETSEAQYNAGRFHQCPLLAPVYSRFQLVSAPLLIPLAFSEEVRHLGYHKTTKDSFKWLSTYEGEDTFSDIYTFGNIANVRPTNTNGVRFPVMNAPGYMLALSGNYTNITLDAFPIFDYRYAGYPKIKANTSNAFLANNVYISGKGWANLAPGRETHMSWLHDGQIAEFPLAPTGTDYYPGIDLPLV